MSDHQEKLERIMDCINDETMGIDANDRAMILLLLKEFITCAIQLDILDALRPKKERTCHDENVGGSFVCSCCGANVRDTNVGKSYVDEWGKRWYGTSNSHAFNFCPNCGAKVVDE